MRVWRHEVLENRKSSRLALIGFAIITTFGLQEIDNRISTESQPVHLNFLALYAGERASSIPSERRVESDYRGVRRDPPILAQLAHILRGLGNDAADQT